MVRPRSDIAPRILHAARRRFLAEGVDGASLRTIARDAKTSVGMVFYYFPSKDDLFLAVVEEVCAQLVNDVSTALDEGNSVRERLHGAFVRLGRVTDDELLVIRLVVREALLVPTAPRFARLMTRFRQGHLAVVLRTLARGVSEGEVDDSVPLPLLMMTSFAMGALPQIARRIAGHEAPFSVLPPPPELASTAVDLLFHGIAPRPPRARGPKPPVTAKTPKRPTSPKRRAKKRKA